MPHLIRNTTLTACYLSIYSANNEAAAGVITAAEFSDHVPVVIHNQPITRLQSQRNSRPVDSTLNWNINVDCVCFLTSKRANKAV